MAYHYENLIEFSFVGREFVLTGLVVLTIATMENPP